MATFLLFGKYSGEALKGISAERTKSVEEIVKRFGGQIQAMYAVLGEVDLVLIVSLPGIAEAIQTSVALSKLTGIAFWTAPAVTVEEFDRLVAAT